MPRELFLAMFAEHVNFAFMLSTDRCYDAAFCDSADAFAVAVRVCPLAGGLPLAAP